MAERDLLLIIRALRFAAEHHVDQRRKGSGQEPYINHLVEVADLVAEATGGGDTALIAAALLHDVIEDQGVAQSTLEREFGPDVANLVAEVTDDKSLLKAERKRLQIEGAAGKSDRAKILSLADKTANVRSLIGSPPASWTLERRREYLDWARAVVAPMREASPLLTERFDEAAIALERSIAR